MSHEGKRRVLLVTHRWDNLAEMPHLLHEAAYCVDVLCPGENICRYSGYLDRWIDSGSSLESLIGKLIDLDRSGEYSYILVGEDPLLWFIVLKPVSALWHLLPIREPIARSMLGKVGFAQLCQQLGIATPDFCVISNPQDVSVALQKLGLPIVTKTNFSSAGRGVRIFEEESSFVEYAHKHNFDQPLLAQRYVEAELISVEALFRDGQLLQYACSIDIAPTLGPSTHRRYMARIPAVGEFLGKLGAFAKLHGFANVTVLREVSSGNLLLIEADPRPNKWPPYGRWFGTDFAVAFQQFMTEGPLSNALYLDRSGEAAVVNWEIEHFDSHFVKLLRGNQVHDALVHLLDFDRTLRYLLHDSTLLREKTLRLRRRIRPSG